MLGLNRSWVLRSAAWRAVAMLCGWLGWLGLPAAGLAGPLDPNQFASLGTLSLSGGSYTILTNANGVPTLTIGSTVYSGVVYNGIAVFDFSSISLTDGVTLKASNVTGTTGLPIALLSRSTVTMVNATVDVSAFPTNRTFAGDGGYNPSTLTYSAGGGGGLGGAGGSGGGDLGGSGVPPSPVSLETALQGGTRGGGPSEGVSPGPYGNAGGGAIEIGAVSSILMHTATINANAELRGVDSGFGGGSGGGIFVHAPTLNFEGANLNAEGEKGSPGTHNPDGSSTRYFAGGGGGGGGLIQIDGSVAENSLTYSLSGGPSGKSLGGPVGYAGDSGRINFAPLTVPEPSSLIMLGTSVLGWLGVSAVRRARARVCQASKL